MRLGQNEEAYQQLEICFNNGFQDAATKNSLKLMDSLQELHHLQDPDHHPQAQQERSGPAAPLLRIGDAARHRDLREEVPDEAGAPGAGRGLSRPRGFRSPHPRHARPGSAGRDFRLCHRHGQPLRPQARQLPLGLHAVARNEPRVHPDHDQPPGAALVHRGPGGARRDRRFARVGRPPRSRGNHRHQGQEAAAGRRTGPRIHPSHRRRARW